MNRVNVKVNPDTGLPAKDGKGIVTGVWPGGAYVDLSFNGVGPVEVINIYSHRTGLLDPRSETASGLREIVTEWCVENASEWPEYFNTYVDNARR